MSAPSSNSRHQWRPGEAAQPGQGSRWPLRLLLAAIALALAGVVAALLSIIKPHREVYFLPLAVGQYGENFPVRCWVRQDQEALCQLPWQQQETFTVQLREGIQNQLDLLQKPTDNNIVVLYLSAYARSGPGDELYILPADARTDDSATWLPLRRVFESLRQCRARHKLLFLDIMQPGIDTRRGALLNDSARRLQPLLDEMLALDDKLSVLSACSPGQLSLTSEELGHSVFAYYLCRGLSGEADGWPNNSGNDRVSLSELVGYVTAKVDSWAIRHRGTRQVPQLRPADATLSYDLVAVGSASLTDPEPLTEDYPDSLHKGWQLCDRAWQEQGFRRARPAFQSMETALLRAEQKWRGGIPLTTVEDNLRPRLQESSRQIESKQPLAVEPISLAAAIARASKPLPADTSDAIVELRSLLALQARTVGPKPDAALKKELDSETDRLLKKYDGKPLELARIVLEVITEHPLPASNLRFLAGLLVKGKVPVFAETRMLNRLTALPLPARASHWPEETIQKAMRCWRLVEQIAVFEDQELVWVEVPLKESNRLRTQGEKLLFGPDREERIAAVKEFTGAQEAYEDLLRNLKQIREAQQVLDQCLVLLDSFAGFLEADHALPDERLEGIWIGAIENTCKLRSALATQPPTNRLDLGKQVQSITDLVQVLRDGTIVLAKLRESLEANALKDLFNRRARAELTDLTIMKSWLRTPWPTTPERLNLWKAWRATSSAVDVRRPEPARLDWKESRAIADEEQRGLRRARWSIELLRLHGYQKTPALLKVLAQAKNRPGDGKLFRQLAGDLGKSWRGVWRSEADEK